MERHWTPESNPKRPRDGGPESLVSKTNLVSTDMPNGNIAKNFQSSPCTGWIWKITAKSLGYISSVQLLSRVQLFMTPMDCSTPGFPVHRQLPEFTQTHVHWVSDAIQPSYALSSPLLPPLIFPSIRVFSNESVLHIRWPKYWSFSFSISLSKEHPGLISFGMDRLDLLAVQGTLKSLLQHHSLKASILWCSAYFLVQLSHP